MPPNKLDGLSVAIGDIQSSLRTLFKRADEDRDTQAKRHEANQKAIGDLRNDMQSANSELRQSAVERWDGATAAIDRVAEIATTRDDTMTVALNDLSRELKEHSDVVANMEPKINSLQMGRAKLWTLASVGLFFLSALGWATLEGLKWIFTFGIKKFGGP